MFYYQNFIGYFIWDIKEMTKKVYKKFCQVKKSPYLCIAFEKQR